MRKLRSLAIGWLSILACHGAGVAIADPPDEVQIANGSGAEIGMLVDGYGSDGYLDGLTMVFNSSAVEVGHLSDAGPYVNRIIAFTEGRAPQVVVPAWTAGQDTVTVTFRDVLEIPVTIWVLKGPYHEVLLRVIYSYLRTTVTWKRERLGIRFGDYEIIDVTSSAPSELLEFDYGDVNDVFWEPYRLDVGFKPGRLNIYYVDTVRGSSTFGHSNMFVWNRANDHQVIMGHRAKPDLLIHEIGHAYHLAHTTANVSRFADRFDRTNVMAPASTVRRFLTEGQIFRAHADPDSVVNVLYGLRPGEHQQDCVLNVESIQCPSVYKRIWPDGPFGAD